MNRFLTGFLFTGSLVLLAAPSSWAQKSGSPSQPGNSGHTGASQPTPSAPQNQEPLYVNGRVVLDGGLPVPEPVNVALYCGTRSLVSVHTDLRGYFQMSLGAGGEADNDFSASNESTVSLSGGSPNLPNSGAAGDSGDTLTGCEVRISVPGYQPLNRIISDVADLNRVEMGTLRLTRIANVQGSSISVTSMLVPGNARKDFEQGQKDVHNNNLKSATEHFEKAVAEYDKYAAAWSQLGMIYAGSQQTEKARAAFTKAIAADPQYIPPYLGLGNLLLETQEYQAAVDTAGKALQLNPNAQLASFVQAVGNYNLNRFDDAEKSAREVLKGSEDLPQAHALLGVLLMRKQDYPDAAKEMRSYLKEQPSGEYAEQLKQSLASMPAPADDAANDPAPPPALSQAVPAK